VGVFMKKLSFLVACLLSLSFPGLNAGSNHDQNSSQKSDIFRKPRPFFPAGVAFLNMKEEAPIQQGFIPLVAKLNARANVEFTETGFKVNKTGSYVVFASVRGTTADIVGPLTISLIQQPATSTETTSPKEIPLFKVESNGKFRKAGRVVVKLAEGETIGLSVTSLPSSGSVTYAKGKSASLIIHQFGMPPRKPNNQQ
jgi:hypothetical protein